MLNLNLKRYAVVLRDSDTIFSGIGGVDLTPEEIFIYVTDYYHNTVRAGIEPDVTLCSPIASIDDGVDFPRRILIPIAAGSALLSTIENGIKTHGGEFAYTYQGQQSLYSFALIRVPYSRGDEPTRLRNQHGMSRDSQRLKTGELGEVTYLHITRLEEADGGEVQHAGRHAGKGYDPEARSLLAAHFRLFSIATEDIARLADHNTTIEYNIDIRNINSFLRDVGDLLDEHNQYTAVMLGKKRINRTIYLNSSNEFYVTVRLHSPNVSTTITSDVISG